MVSGVFSQSVSGGLNGIRGVQSVSQWRVERYQGCSVSQWRSEWYQGCSVSQWRAEWYQGCSVSQPVSQSVSQSVSGWLNCIRCVQSVSQWRAE
jgi:hypothetical protein